MGAMTDSAVVGFRFTKFRQPNVGWVECNETQQGLQLAQPNLRKAEMPWKNRFSVLMFHTGGCCLQFENSEVLICKTQL